MLSLVFVPPSSNHDYPAEVGLRIQRKHQRQLSPVHMWSHGPMASPHLPGTEQPDSSPAGARPLSRFANSNLTQRWLDENTCNSGCVAEKPIASVGGCDVYILLNFCEYFESVKNERALANRCLSPRLRGAHAIGRGVQIGSVASPTNR